MTKEKAMKYINAFYQKKYHVSKEVQPFFWDAVASICENPECDVNSLGLIEAENYCIENYCIENYPMYTCVPTGNIVTFAIKIATEIIKAESIPAENVAFELFIIQKRLEALEANSKHWIYKQ